MKGRLVNWMVRRSSDRPAVVAAVRTLWNGTSLLIAWGSAAAVSAAAPSHRSIVINICTSVAARPLFIRMEDVLQKLAGLPDGRAALRARRVELITGVLAGLAGVLAGRRYAYLREAWAADQYDPETGERLPVSRRLRLAAGDVVAAVRCRLDDAADLAWRPVDALLSSWHGSNLAVLMPVTVVVGLVLSHEGFYGLITNAENLFVVATAPYLAIKGLRKYRQISTPRRPDKKTSSSGGPKR